MVSYWQGQLVQPNSSADEGGSMLFPDLVPTGNTLVTAANNIQPSAEACVAACRQLQSCNVFQFCPPGQGGCASPLYNTSSPAGGCLLANQALSSPDTGRPLVAIEAPGFIGGAPIRFTAPEIAGFGLYLGLGYWYRYDYACPNSTQPGSCRLTGSPEELAPRCLADPACRVMSYFPQGRDYVGEPVTLLKGGQGVALNLSEAIYNANSIMYLKLAPPSPAPPSPSPSPSPGPPAPEGGGGGGGLSTGAIVGIAVGACAGVALLGAAVVCVMRRRGRGTPSPKQLEQELSMRKEPSNGSRAGAPEWSARDARGSGVPAASGAGAAQRALAAISAEPRGKFELEQDWPRPGTDYPSTPPATLVTSSGSGQRRSGSAPQSSSGMQRSGSGPLRSGSGTKLDCPPTPPTTLTTSSGGSGGRVGSGLVPLPSPAFVVSGVPGSQVPPRLRGSEGWDSSIPSPSKQAGSAASSDHLISQLPQSNWQTSIQFCRNPDGSYVELGRGAFCTVYKVVLDGVQYHAAKVLRLGEDERLQDAFLQEATMLQQLRHKNIVGFAGACVAEDAGIILMELMEGRDLHSRLATANNAGQRLFGWYHRGQRVALDMALALHYLHSRNLTHFDIKSKNVLLSRDLTAKLADVGFTRPMRATYHSLSTGRAGTFDYMAPELLMGRPCTQAVDVYSFGVLLWEICTGEYPSRGCLRELHVPEECPQEVASLCMQCMDEDAAERPTARDLVQRLTQLQRSASGRPAARREGSAGASGGAEPAAAAEPPPSP